MHQNQTNKEGGDFRQSHSVTFDDESRIYSTTSGFSSGASSSNSVLSCCNNTEECKFNNSIKRYYSIMYHKNQSNLPRDDAKFSRNDEDTLTMTSSNTCGTNCSCYDSKLPITSQKIQSIEPDCSEFSQNNTIMKKIDGQNQPSFANKILLERM